MDWLHQNENSGDHVQNFVSEVVTNSVSLMHENMHYSSKNTEHTESVRSVGGDARTGDGRSSGSGNNNFESAAFAINAATSPRPGETLEKPRYWRNLAEESQTAHSSQDVRGVGASSSGARETFAFLDKYASPIPPAAKTSGSSYYYIGSVGSKKDTTPSKSFFMESGTKNDHRDALTSMLANLNATESNNNFAWSKMPTGDTKIPATNIQIPLTNLQTPGTNLQMPYSAPDLGLDPGIRTASDRVPATVTSIYSSEFGSGRKKCDNISEWCRQKSPSRNDVSNLFRNQPANVSSGRQREQVEDLTRTACHHRSAVLLLQELERNVEVLREMVQHVYNFRQNNVLQRVSYMRQRQSTVQGWVDSFEEWFESQKTTLVKQAIDLGEVQHKQVVASREELVAARTEVQILEKTLSEQKLRWQNEKEANSAECATLRDREQRLRRQVDSVVSGMEVGRKTHEENVRRLEENIQDLETKIQDIARLSQETEQRKAHVEGDLRERIAMLQNDLNEKSGGMVAENISLEQTLSKFSTVVNDIYNNYKSKSGQYNADDPSAVGNGGAGGPSFQVGGATGSTAYPSEGSARGWDQVKQLERDLELLCGKTEMQSPQKGAAVDADAAQKLLKLLSELVRNTSGKTRTLLAEVQTMFSQVWLMDDRNRDFVNSLISLAKSYPFHCPVGEVLVAVQEAGKSSAEDRLHQGGGRGQSPAVHDRSPMNFLKSNLQERLDTSLAEDDIYLDQILQEVPVAASPLNYKSNPPGVKNFASWTTFG